LIEKNREPQSSPLSVVESDKFDRRHLGQAHRLGRNAPARFDDYFSEKT
jgi:hypothetical protein